MTTTVPPPVAAPVPPPSAPSGARVVAVLVVGADPTRLWETLDALAVQSVAPDELRVSPTGDAPPEALATIHEHAALAAVVREIVVLDPGPVGESVAAAVDRATGATSDTGSPGSTESPESTRPPGDDADRRTWWWLLTPDTAPLPTALAGLLGGVRGSTTAGIVGPKVVQWDDPRLLVGLGHQVTRAGRRLDAPAFGEPDQGQYDQRTDVLAVSLPGMLVRADVLAELGGFDTHIGAGADLDLGWRAQLGGHRVVVAPAARVRDGSAGGRRAADPDDPSPSSTADTDDLRADPFSSLSRARVAERAAQRRAARRVALTRCAWWAVPFLAVWIALSSLVGAVVLLALKRPAHAWVELGDLGSLFHPVSGVRSRWRFRGHRRVRRSHLDPVFVGAGEAVAHTWDRVQEAVTLERSRSTAGGTFSAALEATETGPVAEEAEDLAVLPASLPQRIATHPGTLAVLAAVVASVVTFRDVLGGGLLSSGSPGLSGGELRPVSTTASGLWHLFRDSWHGAGLGTSTDVGPGVGVLAALTWLVERLPAVDGSRSPASLTIAWILLAAMPLSTLTAYVAARVATRASWPRGLAALAWGTSAVLTTALSGGRLSVAVAHVLLPLVLAGVGAAATRRGTWTSVFATVLAAAVVGAFVPLYLPVVVAAGLGLLLLGPHLTARLKGLTLAVVPVALLGPWVVRFVDEPRLLLTGGGLLDVDGSPPPAWQVALGIPQAGVGVLHALLLAPLLVVAVVALARRSRGDGRSAALTALAVLALVGLAAGLLAPRLVVGSAPDAGGAPVLATSWAGLGTDLYVAALLAILLTGWRGIRARLGRSAWGARRLALTAVSAVAVVGVLGTAGLAARHGLGDTLVEGQDAVPAVALDQARSVDATRLLVLQPEADSMGYRLVGDEPGQLQRDVVAQSPTDPGVTPLVSALASGTFDVSGPGLGAALADAGVGFVSLRASAATDVARTLDAAAGLTRLGTTDDQILWRVLPRTSADPSTTTPVPASRVRVVTADGAVVSAVPVVGPHGAVDTGLAAGQTGRRLVLAEAPEWASVARVTYDDHVLSPTSGTGFPTYDLPAGAGRLVVDLPPAHPEWFLLQLVLLVAVVFLAVPFGTRRSRRLA